MCLFDMLLNVPEISFSDELSFSEENALTLGEHQIFQDLSHSVGFIRNPVTETTESKIMSFWP